MTHADSAAGEGYEVTVSLCERLLLTPLIFALIPVKSDKSSFFFLPLYDSHARSTHTVTSVEGSLLQKPLQLYQMLDGEP